MLSDRLKTAMNTAGVSQAQLARACGVKPPTVHGWLNGKAQVLRGNHLLAAAQELKVSERWLSGGVGMMKPQIFDANIEPIEQAGRVPLISWVAAGKWCESGGNFEAEDIEEWLPCPIKHSKNTYALRIRGTSMFNPAGELSFADGDIIFVDGDREAQHKSLVIAMLEDEHESTFKRLLIEGLDRMLEALNPSWPDRIIRITKKAVICGVVIGNFRGFV